MGVAFDKRVIGGTTPRSNCCPRCSDWKSSIASVLLVDGRHPRRPRTRALSGVDVFLKDAPGPAGGALSVLISGPAAPDPLGRGRPAPPPRPGPAPCCPTSPACPARTAFAHQYDNERNYRGRSSRSPPHHRTLAHHDAHRHHRGTRPPRGIGRRARYRGHRAHGASIKRSVR